MLMHRKDNNLKTGNPTNPHLQSEFNHFTPFPSFSITLGLFIGI